MKRRSKKSYNPFRMWGSWIGLIISGIMAYSYISYQHYLNDLACAVLAQNGGACSQSNILFLIISIFISGIIGFLIGWIIHSLLRKFKVVK